VSTRNSLNSTENLIRLLTKYVSATPEYTRLTWPNR
jgi:hypothetical protein